MSTNGPISTTGGWDNPAGRNLSQQERDTIRKLVKAGYRHREIAIRIGRGKATVSRAARAMGFKPAKAKRPWSAQEDHQLIHLLNQGLSQRKIAEALHRHHPAISYRIWFLRSRADSGKEINYLPAPQLETGATKPTAQIKPLTDPAPEPFSPLGLPYAPDIWAIWKTRVFGPALPDAA